MEIDRTQIPILHESYCRETGLHIQCTTSRMYQWEVFLFRKFTLADLVVVCQGMKRQVTAKRRLMACLSFHRLIGDLENFEELLAEYRALGRAPKLDHGKAEVLRATGRTANPPHKEARSTKEIIRADLTDKFAQLKKTLQ